MKAYLKQKNINSNLRMRIMEYLNYIWNKEKMHIEKEAKPLINELSISLKNELLLEAKGKILKKIPFFLKNFSEETLTKAIHIIKETNYM